MADPPPRWATFDCYGTLVDWNRGIGTELGRLFGESRAEELLGSYHAIEPRIQREQPTSSYRDVMALALAELASEAGAERRRRSGTRSGARFPTGRCSPRCRTPLPRPSGEGGGSSPSRIPIAT